MLNLIAGNILPVLGKFHAYPVIRAFMQAGNNAFNYLPGFKFQRGDPAKRFGIKILFKCLSHFPGLYFVRSLLL